jgi:4,5-dihydroxyphthalate decarboxylase
MSLAYLTLLSSSGDRRFVGLPIFLSRMFRHSALFVRNDFRIAPDQLRKKKIGVSSYTMTAAIWVRWLLRTDYQIAPEDLEWFVGAVSPVRIHSSPAVHLVPGGQAELERMLLAGDLDVLLSVVPPKSYLDGSVRRLWSNSREAERTAAEKHKIFPIMHTLVMLRSVYEQNPWAVESLFTAFWEAKELCYQQLLDTDAPQVSLPWLSGNVEEAQAIFGRDYWPYGMNANRRVLETFIRELQAEGLVETPPPLEQIFMPLER